MFSTIKKNEQGFTLVELLVVVVILVALAAIAVPIFLDQKTKADNAATKTSVANVASFIATGIADGSLAGTIGSGNLTNDSGNISTDGMSGSYDNAAGTFCVSATSASGDDWKYTNTSGAVVAGTC